uniref:Uncharacterized protein n=1 Tax=Staphylococcus phage HS14 TaxID=3056404 RepID=A0AA49X583_9VIRU|nr:MAG: hypothetical protein [Staphylococcus phage HS14]
MSVVVFYFKRLDFDTDNQNPSNSTGSINKNTEVYTLNINQVSILPYIC